MKSLENAIIHSYNSNEIIGYKTVTILPTGRVIKLDTGLQGVILSDEGKSSSNVKPQQDDDARGKTPILSLNRKFTPIFQDNALVINAGGRASGKTYASACSSVSAPFNTPFKRCFFIITPLYFNIARAVSEGIAPFMTHSKVRSKFNVIVAGLVFGLY